MQLVGGEGAGLGSGVMGRITTYQLGGLWKQLLNALQGRGQLISNKHQ